VNAVRALPRVDALITRVRQRAFRVAPADVDPVVLRHSRIYILPTRRGCALIGTLAIMLMTSLNYGLSLGLLITFLLSGTVAAALLHTFRNMAGIKVRPLAAGDTFAGDPLAYSVELISGAAARSEIALYARGTRIVSDETERPFALADAFTWSRARRPTTRRAIPSSDGSSATASWRRATRSSSGDGERSLKRQAARTRRWPSRIALSSRSTASSETTRSESARDTIST